VVIEPIVRRVIAGRVPDAAVDDLVHDTLVRLSEPATRMTAEDLSRYAVGSARNAAASYHRTTMRHRRLQAGLLDRSEPDGPDTVVIDDEEAETMRQALAAMDERDRELLEAHHVEGTSIATLAERSGRSEMAVRLGLSRARSRLRVDYTLARHRTELPTERCRPVLVALSSGDRRAQARLDADDHVEGCPTCADLVAPSTGVHRPAVGLLPALAFWWKGLSSLGRRALTFGTTATAAVVVGAAALTMRPDAPPEPQAAPVTTTTTAPPATAPPTTAPPTTTPSGRVSTAEGPVPASAEGLAGAVDQQVDAGAVPVVEVPADEGFWIAADDGGRLWVQLVGAAESPVDVDPGATVSFTGRIAAHGPTYATDVGLPPGPSADELGRQGHHLEVAADSIRVE
jgi:RNA polymerase sigma factor (sigma-70 family)